MCTLEDRTNPISVPEKTLKTGNRTDHQVSAESSPIAISGSKSVVEVENANGDLEQNDYSAENTRNLQTNLNNRTMRAVLPPNRLKTSLYTTVDHCTSLYVTSCPMYGDRTKFR